MCNSKSRLQLHILQVYLRQIARKHVKGEVSTADIERDVKREFGIDIEGKLAELHEPMVKSRVCTQPNTCLLPALCCPRIAMCIYCPLSTSTLPSVR